MPNWEAETVKKSLRNPPPTPVEDVTPFPWAPDRAPARATPLAPEGVESPLTNWARRLIIGPRSIVEQTLREEAQTRRDAARSREAMALEGRRETRARENLLLSIREGARVAEERAARERTEKRTYEQAQRDALAKVVGPRLSPMPTLGVGILSTGERVPVEGPQAPPYKPDLADLLPFEKGLEVHKALTEKEETGVQWDPTKPLVGPRTGRVIKPAETIKEEKHPRAPYALDEAAQSLMDETGAPILNPQTQAPYESFRDLPPGLKQQAWDKAARFQGNIGFERGRGTEEGKRSLPILKRGEWLNPFHFADSRIPLNPPPGTSVAAAEAAQYVNVTDRGDLDALAAIDTIPGVVQPLRVLTDQVITAKTRLQLTTQALRGLGAAISSYVPGISSFVQAERLYNDSKKAFLANLARALGGERGVLTNVDRDVIAKALPSFTDTMGLKDAKWAIIDSIIANAKEAKLKWMALGVGPSEQYAKAKANMLKQLMELGAPPRVKDSQGRVIPAPTKERRIKDPFRDVWGKGVQPQVRHD